MGEIKSALELALEKTADIKSDKSKLHKEEALREGKRMASKFLFPDPHSDEKPIELKTELKAVPKEKQKLVRQGIFDVIISNLNLPSEEPNEELLSRASSALEILLNNRKQVDLIFQQLKDFFAQYLQNKEQIQASLEQQFMPKLRQKEEALRQKFGSAIELEPSQDPEFLEYLKQNYAELDKQYLEALNQMKEQIIQLFSAA